jgi:hypothetical protein
MGAIVLPGRDEIEFIGRHSLSDGDRVFYFPAPTASHRRTGARQLYTVNVIDDHTSNC